MKPANRVYLLIEVECSKEVPDLTDKAAGRVYPISGVENATAILLSSADAYRLAKAQVESHG
jgi:hypothetical protein